MSGTRGVTFVAQGEKFQSGEIGKYRGVNIYVSGMRGVTFVSQGEKFQRGGNCDTSEVRQAYSKCCTRRKDVMLCRCLNRRNIGIF